MRGAMPMPVPDGSRWRAVEDFGRGLPAIHVQFAWKEGQDLVLLSLAGFTLADNPDGTDARETLERRQIPLRTIIQVAISIGKAPDMVFTEDGQQHDDWPVMLIQQHIG